MTRGPLSTNSHRKPCIVLWSMLCSFDFSLVYVCLSQRWSYFPARFQRNPREYPSLYFFWFLVLVFHPHHLCTNLILLWPCLSRIKEYTLLLFCKSWDIYLLGEPQCESLIDVIRIMTRTFFLYGLSSIVFLLPWCSAERRSRRLEDCSYVMCFAKAYKFAS